MKYKYKVLHIILMFIAVLFSAVSINIKAKADVKKKCNIDETAYVMALDYAGYNDSSDDEEHVGRDVLISILFLIVCCVVMRAITSNDSETIADSIRDDFDKFAKVFEKITKSTKKITYCPNCGELLNGDEKFCVKCGGKISKN